MYSTARALDSWAPVGRSCGVNACTWHGWAESPISGGGRRAAAASGAENVKCAAGQLLNYKYEMRWYYNRSLGRNTDCIRADTSLCPIRPGKYILA